MVRTFELEDTYMDEDDPWAGTLAATAFAVRSTCHTTLQATPGQLVFGRDMIFNIKHVADWELIKRRKQERIKYNNKRENKKRTPHACDVGDKVLMIRHDARKYERPCEGPCKIRQVNDNGTVKIKMGKVIDTVNIRRLKPFKE